MNNFSQDWIIYEVVAGSHLYGTNTPDSDVDMRGICIPPTEVLLDPFSNFEQQELPGDHIIYNLRKFVQLAYDCNPNIVELFFVPDAWIKNITFRGLILTSQYPLFISQRVRYTFSGYAEAQLRRIKLHRKWLLNPPKKRPERADFGLPAMPDSKIAGSKIELLHSLTSDNLNALIKPEILEVVKAETAYSSANRQYTDYLLWKRERNPSRAVLEEKFGYDTKHAMHLYRLFSEAEELLRTGKLIFPRPDREYLLKIKNGGLSYDEVLEMGENFKQKIDSMPTELPYNPDPDKIRDFYYELLQTKD